MSQWLDDAWFDSTFQSMLDMLKVDARQRREMIQFLFDEGFWDQEKLTWPAAETRFNACLNRTKADATFKIGEIWALMKRFGRHHFFLAMADDLGYEVRRKPTEERQQELLARILEATERFGLESTGLYGELQRLSNGEPLSPPPRAGLGIRPRLSRAERSP